MRQQTSTSVKPIVPEIGDLVVPRYAETYIQRGKTLPAKTKKKGPGGPVLGVPDQAFALRALVIEVTFFLAGARRAARTGLDFIAGPASAIMTSTVRGNA